MRYSVRTLELRLKRRLIRISQWFVLCVGLTILLITGGNLLIFRVLKPYLEQTAMTEFWGDSMDIVGTTHHNDGSTVYLISLDGNDSAVVVCGSDVVRIDCLVYMITTSGSNSPDFPSDVPSEAFRYHAEGLTNTIYTDL